MFCFWCEEGEVPKYMRKKGYVWIHLRCWTKLNDLRMDIDGVKELLEKRRHTKTIERFLKRMEDFNKKWDAFMDTIKEVWKKC